MQTTPHADTRAASEPRILLIADLSGYTGYLMAGETEEAPAIVGDLVETVLAQLTPPFELAGLEGDAAFLHAPLEALGGDGLLEAIGRCHRAFRRRIESLRQATTCECEACQRVPTLDLKVFVHVGPAVRQRILGREELAGRDVIVLHRLLKDSQPAREGQRRFALLTDRAIHALRIDPRGSGLHPALQEYEHLGEIPGWSGDPETWDDASRPRPLSDRRPGNDTVTFECRLAADRSATWDLLTVPQLRERWEGIERIDEAVDGIRGVGTSSRCVARRLTTVEEIVEWRPPTDFARRVARPAGEMIVAYRLTEASNATDLEVAWRVTSGASPSRMERRTFANRLRRLELLAAELNG